MHIYVDADACPVIHLNKKARRASHKNHISGPRKRTDADDEHFAQSFEKMIRTAQAKEGNDSGII